MGVHHHSDAGILTLLLQDHVAGLEVLLTDQWRIVNPVQGALLVNWGEFRKRRSDGDFGDYGQEVQISDYCKV